MAKVANLNDYPLNIVGVLVRLRHGLCRVSQMLSVMGSHINIQHSKLNILFPHTSGGTAQSDTAVGNQMNVELGIRSYELGV